MSYATTLYQNYQREYDMRTQQLVALQETMLGASGNDILEYRFDDGTGSQRVERRSLKELMAFEEFLNRRINWLWRKLNGRGVTLVTLRRRG